MTKLALDQLSFNVRHKAHETRTMDVARLVDLDGLGEQWVAIRFTRPVEILTQTESIHLVVNRQGQTYKEGSNHNDFYGFLTSMDDVITYAQTEAKALDLGPSSSLISQAVVTLMTRAVIDPPQWVLNKKSQYGGEHVYLHAPDDWYYEDDAFERWLAVRNNPHATIEEQFDPHNRPRRIVDQGAEKVIAWSSDRTDEENDAAMASLAKLKETICG